MKKLNNFKLLSEYLDFLDAVVQDQNRTVAELEDALDCFISFFTHEFLQEQNINDYSYLDTLKITILDKILKRQEICKTYLLQKIKQCLLSMREQNMIADEVELVENIDYYSRIAEAPAQNQIFEIEQDRRKNKTKRRERFISANRNKKLKDIKIPRTYGIFDTVTSNLNRKEVAAC